MKQWTPYVPESLPEAGKEIRVRDSSGQTYEYVFRCACKGWRVGGSCMEIRSDFGALMIKPTHWQYASN